MTKILGNTVQLSRWPIICCILLLCVMPVCPEESLSGWKGSYRPVSRVCEGSVLSIEDSTLSYNTCKAAKTQVLKSSKSELSLKVNKDAKCGVAGWVITLRRSGGSDVQCSGYRTVEDSRAGLPAFECTYRRRIVRTKSK